jgi:Fe-Mn family superoxide dismutase
MFELPDLPFRENALEPYLSAETVRVHYEKHHRGYVDKLNNLIEATPLARMSLEEIIQTTHGRAEYQDIYNNAGQVFNHNLYWQSIGFIKNLDGKIELKILDEFGNFATLNNLLTENALKVFGSGWVWLVFNQADKPEIVISRNGDVPSLLQYRPVFNIDVWEHAYYLDYQNRRKEYVQAFVEHLLNV